jgi:hypothetical protein
VSSAPEIDYERGFTMYVARFEARFGPRALGAFVKFGRHMVTRLDLAGFRPRLDEYVRLHRACKRMLDGGATISDALVLDFAEAAAWVAVEAPDVHGMFRGEMGEPEQAAPIRTSGTGRDPRTDTSPLIKTGR